MTDFNKDFVSYRGKRYARQMSCENKAEAISIKKMLLDEFSETEFMIRETGNCYGVFKLLEPKEKMKKIPSALV